jgi:hypothetical protein
MEYDRRYTMKEKYNDDDDDDDDNSSDRCVQCVPVSGMHRKHTSSSMELKQSSPWH